MHRESVIYCSWDSSCEMPRVHCDPLMWQRIFSSLPNPNTGKHRCLYGANQERQESSTLEMQSQPWYQTPPVRSHGYGRSWGLQDQQWLWQLQMFKIRNQWWNHEMDCKFTPYFPMSAPINICEYGKHHEALATSRKCLHLQRGDTAKMVVSHLEGYCFTWKCLYIGRILIQSFLWS